MAKFADDDSDDTKSRGNLAREQTGMEIPLRSPGTSSAPSNPWPKKTEQDTRELVFAMTKRKLSWRRPGQSNSWDQHGDSSPTSFSFRLEKANKWGRWSSEVNSKQAQPAQPYSLQPAKRGAGAWADSGPTGLVRFSQPDYQGYSSNNGVRWPAALAPGTRLGNLILQDGKDQSGLLQLQGVWLDQIMIPTTNGTRAQ